MNDETPTIVKVVLWGALAGFGGAVKYVSIVLKAGDLVSLRRFLGLLAGNTFVSSFCGIMGGLLANALGWSQVWQFAVAGSIGYLGPQGMDLIILLIKGKFQIAIPVSAVVPVPPAVDPGISTNKP